VIATFNIDQKSGRELRQYLDTVATHCSRPERPTMQAGGAGGHVTSTCCRPVVILLDDLQHVASPASLADAFNALLGLPLHDW